MAKTSKGTTVATAVKGKPTTKPLKEMLQGSIDAIGAVLPRHMTPEKAVKLASLIAYTNPRLAECDPANVLSCVMLASSFGLDLTPSLGEAYLIPRWDWKANRLICQFQIGFRGVRKLAMQSGQLVQIETALVYEKDVFAFRRTPELEFFHEPDCFAPEDARGKIRGVYSLAEYGNGSRSVEVMGFDAIEKIRVAALAAITKKGEKPPHTPWVDHWGEMARKTVLKRHAKSLPQSLELAEALRADNAIYEQVTARVVATLAANPAPNRGIAGLRHRIEAQLPEPTFAADEGVARPLRSEADPDDFAPDPDDAVATPGDNFPAGRMPGED